ncbi:MAG: ECF transporter S component [Culicoidibacterales bacterium]
MKLKSLTSKELTLTASMVALSFILTFLEIPFNPGMGLKIDFALVPIIVIIVTVNRYAGLAALLIQFLLVFFRNPAGWLFNAVASIFFIIPLIIILYTMKKYDTTKAKFTIVFALVVATITTAIITTLINYAFLIPLLFPKFILSLPQSFELYLPFNLLKFSLVSILAYIIIPQIRKYFTI